MERTGENFPSIGFLLVHPIYLDLAPLFSLASISALFTVFINTSAALTFMSVHLRASTFLYIQAKSKIELKVLLCYTESLENKKMPDSSLFSVAKFLLRKVFVPCPFICILSVSEWRKETKQKRKVRIKTRG